MAGAYCKFCDHRCFVDRIMPEDSRWMPGKSVHLATCEKGAEYDRQESGYDYRTAINPHDQAERPLVRGYLEAVGEEGQQ